MIRLANRIILTEQCNLSCSHCFNSMFRKQGMMDADLWIEYMKRNAPYLHDREFRIMGGEPTLHPRIVEIVDESSKYFMNSVLFTNGTTLPELCRNEVFVKNHFTGRLAYAINGFTFNQKKFDEYKEFISEVKLHDVVPLKDVDSFIDRVFEQMKLHPQVVLLFSPDTQINLVNNDVAKEYRTSWMKAMTKLLPVLDSRGIPYGFDHYFPMCFYTQEMIDELHLHGINDLHTARISCCGDRHMGLIDWNFDLYFCNQTRIKIGSILDENGYPMLVPDIMNILHKYSCVKTDNVKEVSDKCRNCAVVASCKTGCFYNSMVRENKDE
jgi:radical SAM protein with 4Fe4S-binding SPASM domain